MSDDRAPRRVTLDLLNRFQALPESSYWAALCVVLECMPGWLDDALGPAQAAHLVEVTDLALAHGFGGQDARSRAEGLRARYEEPPAGSGEAGTLPWELLGFLEAVVQKTLGSDGVPPEEYLFQPLLRRFPREGWVLRGGAGYVGVELPFPDSMDSAYGEVLHRIDRILSAAEAGGGLDDVRRAAR